MCKRIRFCWSTLLMVMILASCSNDEYLNVIPKNSTAVIAIDLPDLTGEAKGVNGSLMKAWFHMSDASDCGIDMTAKVYLFEAPDGNLGMVMKVKDEDDVEEWLDKMARQGRCPKPQKRRGCHFTVLNRSWVAGFNDAAFMVMGPVVSADQAGLMRKMVKYMEAEEGIVDSPMFGKLAEIDSSVAMVAQAQALPDQFVSPFTLGAPAHTPLDQILIAAAMKVKDGCLLVDGNTFSFDEKVDAGLKSAHGVFRQVSGMFLNQLPADVLSCLMMNVDGTRLLPLMKQSESFRAMLTGMSVKIDIDGFVNRVDGDLLLAVPKVAGDKMQMGWAAQLKPGAQPLDVDSEAELARCRLTAADQMLPAAVLTQLKNSRMSLLVNLNGVDEEKKVVTDAFTSLLKPLFGEVRYILYYN